MLLMLFSLAVRVLYLFNTYFYLILMPSKALYIVVILREIEHLGKDTLNLAEVRHNLSILSYF